jgi:hypothetical protein
MKPPKNYEQRALSSAVAVNNTDCFALPVMVPDRITDLSSS